MSIYDDLDDEKGNLSDLLDVVSSSVKVFTAINSRISNMDDKVSVVIGDMEEFLGDNEFDPTQTEVLTGLLERLKEIKADLY